MTEEQKRLYKLSLESQKRAAAHLASGEVGNEMREPLGGVERRMVPSFVRGQKLESEVFDAHFGELKYRFADRVSAIQWISDNRQAWRKANLGNAMRRRLRARCKAEFTRLDEMSRLFSEHITDDMKISIEDAMGKISKLLIGIDTNGRYTDVKPSDIIEDLVSFTFAMIRSESK